MVRVAGLTYALDPFSKIGRRVSDLRVNDKPLQAGSRYKVAGWAPVDPEAKPGEPAWDVLARYLRATKTIAPLRGYAPRLLGVDANPGVERA
jgi:sulfur-oxidizing protein SoxB